MSRSTVGIEAVRLAYPSDRPAERLLCIETRVQTGDDFMDAFEVTERTLGEKVSQGSLFAYLFRRFGHPNKGSDPERNLASYLLTTTHPEMLLMITPYAGGDTSISFQFMVPGSLHYDCHRWTSRARDAHKRAFHDWIEVEGRIPDWADDTAKAMEDGGWPIPDDLEGWRRVMPGMALLAWSGVKEDDPQDRADAIRWYESTCADYEAIHPVPDVEYRSSDVDAWDDLDPLKPIARAMAETLEDLKRPVWIRDVAIGIHGHIEDEDLGADGPEAAEAAASAGYPLGTLGNQDPESFSDLMAAVLALDPDQSAAIAEAMRRLRGTSADEGVEDEDAGDEADMEGTQDDAAP